jgi:hypothetical protein
MSVPPRTTANQVIAVLSAGEDYDTLLSPDITPYIETASNIIDMIIVCAARKKVPVTDIQLELMERWLAAHLYAVSDKPMQQTMTLRSSATFQGQTGMNLCATLYGQTAIMNDPSGCLNNIDKQSRVRAFWGGKDWSQRLPWWMRGDTVPPTTPLG